MDIDTLHRTITDALSASLAPYVATLESRLAAVEDRIASNVPRRHITDSTKQRHKAIVTALGSRCPCCGVNVVLDEDGRVLEADYDHFYSRERREFTETWLICRPCHRGMGDRIQYTAAFQAYQQRAVQIEAGQMVLFA